MAVRTVVNFQPLLQIPRPLQIESNKTRKILDIFVRLRNVILLSIEKREASDFQPENRRTDLVLVGSHLIDFKKKLDNVIKDASAQEGWSTDPLLKGFNEAMVQLASLLKKFKTNGETTIAQILDGTSDHRRLTFRYQNLGAEGLTTGIALFFGLHLGPLAGDEFMTAYQEAVRKRKAGLEPPQRNVVTIHHRPEMIGIGYETGFRIYSDPFSAATLASDPTFLSPQWELSESGLQLIRWEEAG